MRLFVGITDSDWHRLHASKPQVEEVNFWRPSSDTSFKALSYGDLFLFKLHAPRNFIAGGGFFARFLHLPLSLAWESFGEGNGARSLGELKAMIARRRRERVDAGYNPRIGCTLLEEPFFFEQSEWIPAPPDFALNIVQGKGYSLEGETGRSLWREVTERLELVAARMVSPGPAVTATAAAARYGLPVSVRPRLGQGSFRAMVTDAYRGRCAVTSERTLPALEASHIRPYAAGGEHALPNGLLLRSDLHRLFDRGYVTVDPEGMRLVVSGRIREEFSNGRDYYALHGRPLARPDDPRDAPARENIIYHAQHIFIP